MKMARTVVVEEVGKQNERSVSNLAAVRRPVERAEGVTQAPSWYKNKVAGRAGNAHITDLIELIDSAIGPEMAAKKATRPAA